MPDRPQVSLVRIEPYGEDDFDLLVRSNTPEMTEHLGGPENEEKIRQRHQRYLAISDPGTGGMFRVELVPEGDPVGIVGYWEHERHGETVYEIGWGVFPEYQGRGLAVAGTLKVVERARGQHRHRSIHAFPRIDHPASNGVCQRAGFELVGAFDFKYPVGNPIRCNDWRIEF